MKIKFIVGNPAMNVAKDWNEILEWNKSSLASYSYEEYLKIKGLEIIDDFENEIKKSRKKLNIPERGMDYGNVVIMLNKFTILSDDEKSMLKKIKLEEQRINNIFILDNFIKKQIKSLIISDFVFPGESNNNLDGSINYEIIRDEEFDENGNLAIYGISININRPVKKNKLIKFIKDNWNSISIAVDELSENKFNLTDYEIEIFNLRNQKLPFKTIADEVIKKQNRDNITGEINEDSVKTSFHRTKEKLSLLVKRKVTKK